MEHTSHTRRRAPARDLLFGLTLALGAGVLTACDRMGPERLAAPAPTTILTCEENGDPSCYDFPPPPTPAYGSRYGLVVGGLVEIDRGWTDHQVRQVLGLAKQSGAKYVRETFYWRTAQRDGPYFNAEWLASAERFVDAATDSGLVIMVTLASTPGWVRGNDRDPTHYQDPNYHDLVPGTNIIDDYNSGWYPPYPNMWIWYQYYVQALVQQFGSRITYWGIGNEPNTTDFLKMPRDGAYGGDWLAVTDRAWEYASYAIQSNSHIMVGPDLANTSPETLGLFLARSGWRLRPRDIVSVHWYGYEDQYGDASLGDRVRGFDNVLRQHGKNNQLWVTEEGPAQPEGDDAFQSRSVAKALTTFNNTTVSRWTALFRFHLWSPEVVDYYDTWLVRDAMGSPQRREGYYCLQAFALGYGRPAKATACRQ